MIQIFESALRRKERLRWLIWFNQEAALAVISTAEISRRYSIAASSICITSAKEVLHFQTNVVVA